MTRRTYPIPAIRSTRVMSQSETIQELLRRSKRSNQTVPIRRAFVQKLTERGHRSQTEPGPLHQLMRSERAFDLLLLMYAVTSGGDFSVTERSETWGRASGVSFDTAGGASAAVSRLWQKLAAVNLIDRSFDGRYAKITKLLEDGSGKPYTKPSGSADSRKDVYFQVPYQYWTDNLHKKLDMAGKAVMCIAMSLREPKFAMPETPTFAGYYKISESTLHRGIAKLIEAEILDKVDSEEYATLETRSGYGVRTLYAFRPPYDLNVKADADDSHQPNPGSAPTSGSADTRPEHTS